jgi:hypothetical protein
MIVYRKSSNCIWNMNSPTGICGQCPVKLIQKK